MFNSDLNTPLKTLIILIDAVLEDTPLPWKLFIFCTADKFKHVLLFVLAVIKSLSRRGGKYGFNDMGFSIYISYKRKIPAVF